MAREGIPAEYMQRVKQYMQKAFLELQNQNNAWLNSMQDYYRRGIDSQYDYLSTLDRISQKDIQRVMKAMLKSRNRITVVMLPEDK